MLYIDKEHTGVVGYIDADCASFLLDAPFLGTVSSLVAT